MLVGIYDFETIPVWVGATVSVKSYFELKSGWVVLVRFMLSSVGSVMIVSACRCCLLLLE